MQNQQHKSLEFLVQGWDIKNRPPTVNTLISRFNPNKDLPALAGHDDMVGLFETKPMGRSTP
jgi:hypothetical protein